MNWTLVYVARKVFADSPFQIGRVFNSPLLIVKVSSTEAQPSWSKAGTLFPVLSVPDVGLVEGVGRRAYLKTKVLRFENLGLPFDLKFCSVGYLPSLTLSIWEPESLEDSLEQKFNLLRDDLMRIEKQIEFISKRDVVTQYDIE